MAMRSRPALSLQARPGEALLPDATPYAVPDVVVWHADRTWHVALNPATAPTWPWRKPWTCSSASASARAACC